MIAESFALGFLTMLAIALAYSLGRVHGRGDVLDHGWKRAPITRDPDPGPGGSPLPL